MKHDDDEVLPPGMTGQQKVALMLRKAGYSNAFIADKLNLKNTTSVSRLIRRALKAERDAWAWFRQVVGEN